MTLKLRKNNHKTDYEEVYNVFFFEFLYLAFVFDYLVRVEPLMRRSQNKEKVWQVRDLAVLNFLTNF